MSERKRGICRRGICGFIAQSIGARGGRSGRMSGTGGVNRHINFHMCGKGVFLVKVTAQAGGRSAFA